MGGCVPIIRIIVSWSFLGSPYLGKPPYRGYIGILEKKMEAPIWGLGFKGKGSRV